MTWNLDAERLASWDILIIDRNTKTKYLIRTDLKNLTCYCIDTKVFPHLSSWCSDTNQSQRNVDKCKHHLPESSVHENHTSQTECFDSMQMFIGTNV